MTGPRFPNPVIGLPAGGVVVGEFNGDGWPDVAITDRYRAEVVIETGRGDATFDPERRYPVGSGPGQMVSGDFDRDGHQDLAVVNEGASFNVSQGDVSILLGHGDGSFELQARLPVGVGPRGITVGDFNGDGSQDLAVINLCTPNNGCSKGAISVLIGLGDGTFAPATSYLAGGEPNSIVSADFNGDGHADLIVGNAYMQYPAPAFELSLLLGNGDGTFGPEIPTGAPFSGSGPIAVGDLNADGRPDLAVSFFKGSVVGILLGHGDGTFQERLLSSGGRPFGVEIADFNGDGHQDVATADQQSDDVSVFLGRGDGTFSDRLSVPAGNGASVLAFGDLDVDGRVDMVVGNDFSETVLIRLGNGDGSFGVGARQLDNFDVHGSALADFNLDGKPDLVVSYAEFGPDVPNGDLSVLQGNGDGTFGPELHLGGNIGRGEAVSGDFNRDGKPDFAVGNRTMGNISVFLGSGDGAFGAEMVFPAGSDPAQVAAGDLNGDGVPDLVVVNQGHAYPVSGGDLSVLIGRGNGTFDPETRIAAGTGPVSVTLADYDADGRTDLAVVNVELFGSTSPGHVLIFLGRGDGTFSPGPRLDTGATPLQAVARDFNGDGRLDLAVDNRGNLEQRFEFFGGDLSLFFGNGDGTFQPQVRLSAGGSPLLLVAADIDGDGRVDLATANVSFDISVLFGQGDGTFDSPARFGIQGFSQALAAADFDGDDLIDLAGIGFSALTVLSQRPPPDRDGDGILNAADNCPRIANPGQEDGDEDGVGDACDDCPVVGDTGQQDADHDGSGDACDSCTDSDRDGFGNPGFPAATCPPDNCPAIANAGQGDTDGDGLGDACDPCTDRDGDGLGDSGFPGNTCATDNCPGTANADQADLDRDGIGDACDPCIDSDHDGFGDAGSTAASCLPDNCPAIANPAQADRDRDGIGDACDPCTDPDGDGYRDPGFPGVCPVDNCPSTSNPSQSDADYDGLGDACDTCPRDAMDDADRDGHCADRDNCPGITNPDQADSDGDGHGDPCDNCPAQTNADQADGDDDHAGDACDTCQSVANQNQADLDSDGAGDTCDNCPAAANPAQEDVNADGSGDACQPVLIFHGARASGDRIEVAMSATDPQNDSLSGTVEISDASPPVSITLRDSFASGECGQGYLPGGVIGEGIGFTNGAAGAPYLFDLGGTLYCGDALPDYLIAMGTCALPQTEFLSVVSLAGVLLPTAVCLRRIGEIETGPELTILGFDESTLVLSLPQPIVLRVPFDHGPPAQLGIADLVQGATYRLRMTVTDGTTVPVAADLLFVYHGESLLVFTEPNSPPHASVFSAAIAECTSPAGGVVRLDGSGSTDADSTPGTNDDIVSFGWFENPGQPGEVVLGSGMHLDATLPLGIHLVGLVVTDSTGETDTAQFTVMVRDTVPPHLSLTLTSSLLWPPNHRMMEVHAAWQVTDACDPEAVVALASATSSEPDDRPGNGDGNTTGDVQDATIGTPDPSVLLRAERSGDGPGRVYALTYRARDASGNAASALEIATVPHDTGTGPEPLILNLEGAGTPGLAHIYWNAVMGAEVYDVIRGDLDQVAESGGKTSLGRVHVLASGQAGESHAEGPDDAIPTEGKAFFYLVQYRQGQSASGWGTESSPWPTEPSSCDIGCPGQAPITSSVLANHPRR